jgi:hypothetical protein
MSVAFLVITALCRSVATGVQLIKKNDCHLETTEAANKKKIKDEKTNKDIKVHAIVISSQ